MPEVFFYHYNEAKKLGIDVGEINETVEFAKAIRLAGNQGMDEFVQRMVGQDKDK